MCIRDRVKGSEGMGGLVLKEAIMEVQSFSNFDEFESKLLGALESSFFNQYASVIPFWKALDIHILDS